MLILAGCYAYAVNTVGMDDGFIGGDEISDLCSKRPGKPGSKCFDPPNWEH